MLITHDCEICEGCAVHWTQELHFVYVTGSILTGTTNLAAKEQMTAPAEAEQQRAGETFGCLAYELATSTHQTSRTDRWRRDLHGFASASLKPKPPDSEPSPHWRRMSISQQHFPSRTRGGCAPPTAHNPKGSWSQKLTRRWPIPCQRNSPDSVRGHTTLGREHPLLEQVSTSQMVWFLILHDFVSLLCSCCTEVPENWHLLIPFWIF